VAENPEERVAIVDLADELQVRKQRIFKLLRRLDIRPTQQREPSRGNQNIAMVTLHEATKLRAEIIKSLDSSGVSSSQPGGNGSAIFWTDDVGFFYIIQLEPDHDPSRFKVGFTMDLDGRLQKHRCSAPYARYLQSWPCLRAWERAAIDCVTDGCAPPHRGIPGHVT
jgi:hypothetical protein